MGGLATVLSSLPEQPPAGKPFNAYDVEVEGDHSYFVGEPGVWVHNSGPFSCKRFRDWFVHTALVYVPKKYAGRIPTNWETFMITFQRIDREGKQYTWRSARNRLLELTKHFQGARPTTYQYRLAGGPPGTPTWHGNPLTKWLIDEGLQGQHWWPQNQLGSALTTGGATERGAVFAVANPYLHTRGPVPKNAYGMHPVLWDFLRDYWNRLERAPPSSRRCGRREERARGWWTRTCSTRSRRH